MYSTLYDPFVVKQSSAIQNAIEITEQVGCYTPHSTPPQSPSDEPFDNPPFLCAMREYFPSSCSLLYLYAFRAALPITTMSLKPCSPTTVTYVDSPHSYKSQFECY